MPTTSVNPAFSTGLTDVVGMVTPRTAIDAHRNKFAAIETFRREISGTINNNVLPGFVAFAVAAAIQPAMKVKTTIWANSETMDVLNAAWDSAKDENGKKTEDYVRKVFCSIEGRDGEKWNKFSQENWDELLNKIKDDKNIHLTDPVKKMTELIKNPDLSRKQVKEGLKEVQDSIGAVIKAREDIKVNVDKKELNTTLEYLVRDTRDMGVHVFNKYAGKESGMTINKAISRLKTSNKIKAAIPLAILCTLDFSTQYLNRKKTNKDTGRKGFVGYADFGHNDCEVKDPKEKEKLKLRKLMGLGALVGLNLLFMGKKLEFKNIYPSLDQIKLLYSTTVAGRIVASDDKNELRETCTRDFFSYLNWLVLGNFVTKGIVWSKDTNKSMFNFGTRKDKQITYKSIHDETNPLRRFWDWSHGTSIKTHSEILDMERSKTIDAVSKAKKLKLLNTAIGAGLVYSTVMLGIGVPILNMYLTNKKRTQELAAQKLTQNNTNSDIKSSNNLNSKIS